MSENDNFTNNMTPETSGFDAQSNLPRVQGMAFERGSGGGTPNFDEVMKSLRSGDQDIKKQARIERRKMGKEADDLHVVEAAQSIVAGVYERNGIGAFKQVNEGATKFEEAVREDPNFEGYKNATNLHSTTGLGGIAAEIFKKEVDILKFQVDQNKNSDPTKEEPAAWYPREKVDYVPPKASAGGTRPVIKPLSAAARGGSASFSGGGNNPPPPARETPPDPEREEPQNEILKRMGLKSIDEISVSELRRLAERFGVREMNDLNSKALEAVYLKLDAADPEDLTKPGEAWDESQYNSFMAAANSWIEDFANQSRNTGSVEGLMRQQLEISQRSARMEEQGLKRSEEQLQDLKAGFFNNVLKQERTIAPPARELWFGTLSRTEQDMVNRMFYQVLGIEGKKGGAKMLDQYREFFRMPREEMEKFWQFDGFRMTMATLMDYDPKPILNEDGSQKTDKKGNLLFDEGQGLFTYGRLNPTDAGISDGGKKLYGLVLTDKGRKLIQEVDLGDDTKPSKFDVYRQGIITKLEAFYKEHPDQIPFGFTRMLKDQTAVDRGARAAAEAGFASAWGLVSLSLVPEAGDTNRKVVNFDSRVFSFGWRTTLHPHGQGVRKWVTEEENRGAEERIFGVAGPWFEERNRNDANFREKFRTYQPGSRYFLRATLGSAFDHTRFTHTQKTLSDTLVNSSKVNVVTSAGVIKDYENGSQSIDYKKLMDGDIGSHYTDLLDNVVKMQDFLTTNEVKNPQGQFSDFLGAIQTLQDRAEASGDPLLRNIYGTTGDDVRDRLEDMVVGAMGTAGGKGFEKYSSIPLIDDAGFPREYDYDSFVGSLLQDARIYKILAGSLHSSPELMSRLYERVAAYPESSGGLTHFASVFLGTDKKYRDSVGSGGMRTRIRENIEREKKRLGITKK